jgi:hypothetical protein
MVAGQLMEKLGINALQKKTSRSATTRIMRSNGQLIGSVDDDDDDDVERSGMEASVARQSMEKSTAAGQSVEKSGYNSLQKKASRSAFGTSRLTNTSTSTSTSTSTGTRTMMGSNGQLTRSVNVERVGMELEQSELVAGQSVEKSGITSLQKEISRSATSTSRVAKKSTSTSTMTMMGSMMGSNGYSTGVDDARIGMDLREYRAIVGIKDQLSPKGSTKSCRKYKYKYNDDDDDDDRYAED